MDSDIKIIGHSVANLMLVGVLLSLIGALILLARLLAGESVTSGAVNIYSGASILVGVTILCFRHGFILDRQQRTSAKWLGLFIPFHKRAERRYSSTCYVSIANTSTIDPAKATPLSDAVSPIVSEYQTFAVELQDPGATAISLHELPEYDAARRLAEDIAKFLNVDLHDRSSKEEVVREAGRLDEPLREHLRRAGQSVPLPAQIDGGRAIVRFNGNDGSTSIEIPPAGMNLRSALRMGFGVCGLWSLGYLGFMKSRIHLDAGTLPYVALVLFLIALALALPVLIRAFTYREHLVVSPKEINIARYGILRIQHTRLASAEVEEVVLVSGRFPRSFHDCMSRVVVRSDRGSVELGASILKAEEVRWLRDILIYVLTPDLHNSGPGSRR